MDIAQIGFKADTSDLDKARMKLEALKPAAAAAAGAADKLTVSVEGAAVSVQNAAVSVARAEQSKAEATLRTAMASGTATKADIAAARAALKKAAAAMAVAKAERDATAALNATAMASRKSETAALSAAAAYKQQSAAARNAFNTAAGAKSGPIPANDQMPNRFNTANIAAQFQDIGVTAAMGMNPMTIALQQGTQLSAILQSMENPLKGLQIALKSVFNTLSLGTIAIVGIVAALIQFVNWVSVAKGALNGLATIVEVAGPYFLGLAATIALIYAPTVIAGLATVTTSVLSVGLAAGRAGLQMATAWVIAMGPIGWVIGGIALILTAMNMFRDEMAKMFGFDLIEPIKKFFNHVFGSILADFEGLANVFARKRDIFKKGGITVGQAFKEGFDRAKNRDYVGEVSETVVADASAAAAKLRSLAAGLGEDGKKKRGKTDAEKFDDIINGANRTIESLKAEQAALGMTAQAAARLKYETDLLNDARQKSLSLTPVQRAQLGALAETMAQLSEETRKSKEAIDFTKDATKGFVSDMRSGLQQGKSLWESFGNAVQNVLNKVLDKMTDLAIDQMFQSNAGGGGMGSFLSSAFSFLFNAKGNAFNAANDNGIQRFAKGGDFTNSVVSSPTLFRFAKGAGLGEMGEAGPEAIMPLHRGADGSLGVKVNGSGRSGGDTQVIVNNYTSARATVQRRQTPTGEQVEIMIDDTVGQQIGQRGSSVDRALTTRGQRQLIRR